MKDYFNNLWEIDNVNKILVISSDEYCLNYLLMKYPKAKIDEYKNNEQIDKRYDLVFINLLANQLESLLTNIVKINSKYFLIYDYKDNPFINSDVFTKIFKEQDIMFIDYEKSNNFKECIYLLKSSNITDVVFKFLNDSIKLGNIVSKLKDLKTCYYSSEQLKDINRLIKKIEDLTEVEKLLTRETDNATIKNILLNNKTYLDIASKMTSKDVLLMITDYICAKAVPKITQDFFDEMIDVGIKYNKKENLWRLAFSYEHLNMNFNKIIDYYIKIKDSYYLSELLYAVGSVVDKKRLVNILLKETDKNFVKDFLENNSSCGELEENDIKLLEESIN